MIDGYTGTYTGVCPDCRLAICPTNCPGYVDVSVCEYCDELYATDDGEPHPTREVVFCSKKCIEKYDAERDKE